MINNNQKNMNMKIKTSGIESPASLTPGAVMNAGVILNSRQRLEITKITRRLKNSLTF